MRTIVHSVRTFVLICAFALCAGRSSSQSITTGDGKVEIGLGLGPMFFLGDLGGNYGTGKTFIKDVNLPLTKLSKGVFISVAPTEWLAFRFAFNQSMVDGYDSIIKSKGGEEEFRKARNLDFRSNIWEGYGAVEFYPSVFFEQYDGLKGKFRPYGIAGIGLFHFNPQGLYYPNYQSPSNPGSSVWVDLTPLRLEGQGMSEYPTRPQYSLTQIEIPMGLGFKWYLKENLYVGMEVLHRKTFTDYMDGVSKDYIDPNLFKKYLSGQQLNEALQLYYRGDMLYTTTSRIPPGPPSPGTQRGDPKQNDAFFSTILRMGWRLNDAESRSRSRQSRCPTFY